MATLASMTVRLGIDTDQLRAGADSAKGVLKGLGKAVAGLGVGAPIAAAVAAGVGGMAAAFATAGIAAKAFQLAVGPQMQAVTEVSDLAAEAEKAAAEGAEDAAEKQKAYTDALNRLPPATRAMAKEFIGLKKDYKGWSDSLSSSTMPVFTKALQIVRRLLPLLTPFVKEAAKAFGEFVDEIDRSTKGKGLDKFAASLAKVAGRNLKSFLFGLKNIAVGIGGVIKAFLPLSDEMSGGFEESTAAFAKWGQSLGDSQGFADFIAMAREGGDTLGTLARAAVQLLVAAAPLIGITAQLATWLASIINNTPTPVLTALAIVIGTVTVAMKAWAIAQAIVAARNRIWTATQWSLNASMFASPVFWIIAAIVALIVIIVLIATKTTWFQTAWHAAWEFIKMVTAGAVAAIGALLGWFAGLPGKFAGWFGAAKDTAVRLLLALLAWLRGLPGKAGAALAGLVGSLRTAASNGFNAFKSAAASRASSFISWVRGLPGRIARAIGSLSGLLVSKGKDVVRGLWNGIKSMGAWLKKTLIGWAKALIPGPIAKALGISSPSKVMAKEVGRWVPAGVVQGAEDATPAMDKALRGLVDVPGLTSMKRTGTASAAGQRVDVRITVDGPEAVKRLIRSIVTVDGRGDVQTAFGR